MSNETLVIGALLGVIAALVVLLRAGANAQNANTDEHRLVVQLATQGISNTARLTDIEKSYKEATGRETSYKAQITTMAGQIEAMTALLTEANTKIDAQSTLIIKANRQIELLNEQITELRHELAISKQPGDTTAADAANVQHKLEDAEAAAPTATTTPDASPEIDSST